jgi:hypothetical protein
MKEVKVKSSLSPSAAVQILERFVACHNHDRSMPIGLLDFMECYLHEVVHNLYPDAPKDIFISKRHWCSTLVREKTREIWFKGMAKICDVLRAKSLETERGLRQ